MSLLASLRRSLTALDWVAVALAAVGLALVATGLLPRHETGVTIARIWPLLLFLSTVLVLAELTTTAGVFDVLATRLAIVARGRIGGLFTACVAVAALTTICLNLDTTAVLLTPVMLALAAATGAPALPLAMCTVWLANTASLLLPVSNLTNLLAAGRVALPPAAFAARMGLAQLVALGATAGLLWLLYWRPASRGAMRYELPEPFRPGDPWLAAVAGLACLLFIGAALAGLQLGVASSIAAGVVVVAFAVRKRSALGWALIPWRLPVLVTGLFLVVQTISLHLLGPLAAALIGSSGGAAATFRAAATGAVLANLVNNLPAYLAGEAVVPAAHHAQLLGLLIGVNAGPVITPWGSLATVLWRERCAAAGVAIGARRFMLSGTCLAVTAVGLSVAALAWA